MMGRGSVISKKAIILTGTGIGQAVAVLMLSRDRVDVSGRGEELRVVCTGLGRTIVDMVNNSKPSSSVQYFSRTCRTLQQKRPYAASQLLNCNVCVWKEAVGGKDNEIVPQIANGPGILQPQGLR
jgi:hypothetical protein